MDCERLMTESKTKGVNYGWALLRSLMCFVVLLIHLWPNNDGPIFLFPFSMLKGLPVPIFIILSFYLNKDRFLENNSCWIKKRIFRLYYPHIVWTLVYFIANLLMKNDVTVGAFLWQFFTGHSPVLNPPMWYIVVLLLVTVSFFLFFKYIKLKYALRALFIIFLFLFAFEYAGINSRLLGGLRFELKYPLGRFFEMIPYAVLGFFAAYYGVFEQLKSKRLFFITLFGVVSLFLLKFKVINSAPGFGYSINNFTLLSFFVVGFAYLIPFERLPMVVLRIINFITSHTLGVYCMHLLVAGMLRKNQIFVNLNGFFLSLFVYFVSFMFCHVVSKIPNKYFKMVVD